MELLVACKNKNHSEIERLLADADLDVNFVDENTWTPLKSACLHNDIEAVRLLLSRSDIDINKKDEVGRTPIVLSIEPTSNKQGETVHKDEIFEMLMARPELNLTRQVNNCVSLLEYMEMISSKKEMRDAVLARLKETDIKI